MNVSLHNTVHHCDCKYVLLDNNDISVEISTESNKTRSSAIEGGPRDALS